MVKVAENFKVKGIKIKLNIKKKFKEGRGFLTTELTQKLKINSYKMGYKEKKTLKKKTNQ